jgi:hypothetical protein
LGFKQSFLCDAGRGEPSISVVTLDNRKFFRIRSENTHHPALVDLVQSEHAEWVIMFSVQKLVDILGG